MQRAKGSTAGHLSGLISSIPLQLLVVAGALAGSLAATPVYAQESCVRTRGYWRTHPEAWPVQALVLGTAANPGHTYATHELLWLLDLSVRGDASLILAAQHIAAKLNIASGSNPSPIAASLTRADALLGAFAGRLPLRVTPNTPIGADMTSVARMLEAYNEGALPGSCGSENRAPIAAAGPDQTAALLQAVTLDGSGSSDPDGDAMTFAWRLVTAPAGSAAALSNATIVNPVLVPDVHGEYTIELIVADGALASAPDTVRISTVNSRPTADAGRDRTALVQTVVTLDASGSTDVDGDPLTYRWSVSSRPEGSAAGLTDPASLRPSFTVDRSGVYVFQLIVNDGREDSDADLVTITTENSVPVSSAGPDQSAFVGALIQLDGSGSTDVDGDLLTYRWSLSSVPPGSGAALSDPSAVRPTFTIDRHGDYVAQLIVHDGSLDSPADTVTVSTVNRPPGADAGPDQTVEPGSTVQLTGLGSTDSDGDPLTFRWSIISAPAGSLAVLSDPASPAPVFVADVFGTYVAQLIVNDGHADSLPDTVTISMINSVPIAHAGPDQSAATGASVTLDGSASSDPDGSPLQFSWALIARPAGSTAVLSDPAAVNPGFTADVAGVYVAQLIVGDGLAQSVPDTVTVTVQDGADLGIEFISVPDAPPVGTFVGFLLQLTNNSAARPEAVTARFAVPAGYRATGFPSQGTYDVSTGEWTVGGIEPFAAPTLFVSAEVLAAGPYDLQAAIIASSLPDPNPDNDTASVAVAPDATADLSLSLAVSRSDPAVGSRIDISLTVINDGPAATDDVRIRFPLPAGYTIRSASTFAGTYDPATGGWTIGRMDVGAFLQLNISADVNASGPYDLSAAIDHSSGPDPDPGDNAAAAAITPNANADLRVEFFNPPTGTKTVGTDLTWMVELRNAGPATATGVVVRHLVPAGYTITSVNVHFGGPYDPATGAWSAGTIVNSSLARLIISARVNAAGPTGLSAAVIEASQPDPIAANNTAVVPPINRPPVAAAGPDQATATHATVALDGTASGDADGDHLTFQWTFDLRPVNSTAAFAAGNSVAASFVPDQGGTYVARLTAIDPGGAASSDTVTIVAEVRNHPPSIHSAPPTSGAVGQPYSYAVHATDPDAGDVLSYSLTVAPAGMAIDSASGAIAWTPAADQGGPQPVTVRVADAGGLFAVQTFAIQVASSANGVPVAQDDAFEVRVNESLGAGTPGVLLNDTDDNALSARLEEGPANGTLSFKPDGSFVYTPHTQQPGELVMADGVNLAARLSGARVNASGFFFNGSPCGRPECAVDENLATSWSANAQTPAFLEVEFPHDVVVTEVHIVGHRNAFLLDDRIIAGIFQVFAADGSELYTSGNVELAPPSRDARLRPGRLDRVRRVRFTATAGEGGTVIGRGFAEFKVIGSSLMRRELVREPNVARRLPASVQASSVFPPNIPEALIDESPANWFAETGNAGEFVEITLPRDATVTSIESANPSGRPDGFGTSIPIDCHGRFTLLDASGQVLFDSGLVNAPTGGLNDSVTFSLATGQVPGVRRVRYTSDGCTGHALGFSEIRVFGTVDIETPALSMVRKIHALAGREAHSTPIVVNLTDDNGDGAVNADDTPDILVPVEQSGQNQLGGPIVAISGDDGRELFTAGAPDLVSPWSELAAGDLDGDGLPEIVAVHSDGNHLIAFDHTGAIKWVSDANPTPRFDFLTGTGNLFIFRTGAIAIANLDGAGGPEIVIGASVFDANGRLLGDGRTLGGTIASNVRSSIPAVADIDLDGTPEIVAGPTAYRLSGGALVRLWQRTDRGDGYVGIANLDDDPQAESVIVSNGAIYVLNHDGSDQETWNAPSHAPVPLPGGGQGGAPLIADVDGDGRPEIGVAGAARYVLFNHDGSIRWQAIIRDRSSHSTGSIAFDLDGDGQVEIIYRDELFLRVYRGSDGVLLAKTAIGSSTWAEEPVVADVDNDGHADLVVSSDYFSQAAGEQDTGLIVLQDVANRWMRTRRIWNQHAYHVTNVNEDASMPLVETPHWLLPGANSFRTNAFVAGESPDRADRFTYTATDGVLRSNVATVRIDIRTPNAPPSIISSPATSAAAGVRYVYAAVARDPDAGDILAFSLPAAPGGMAIDPHSGLIHWVPDAAQRGSHQVTVKVQDLRGLFALQGFTVIVADAVAVPDVAGQPREAAESAIATAALAVGAVSMRHSPSVADGAVITHSPAAGTLVAPGSAVNLVVSIGPAPTGTVPDLVGMARAGAEADIAAAGFTVGPVTGQNHTTVPANTVLAQTPAGGTIAATGSAIALVVSLGPPPGEVDLDRDGFTGNQGDCNDSDPSVHPGAADLPGDGIDQNCNGRDSVTGDDLPPAASIESPAEDAELSMPRDIVGSASDANFLRYTLALAPVDSTAFVTLATGTAAVTAGVLGRIDPTMLENGLYRVRLTAEDVNGQTAVAERVYQVGGEAKVGIFGLTFVDLHVPVSGVPITVMRSYDSRVKTSGDFGIGWRLEVKAGKFQSNRRPGDGWSITTGSGPFGLPCTVVSELRSHLTQVRLSDREFYVFRPALRNVAAVAGGCVGTLAFEQVGGTIEGATLEVTGGSDFIYTSGEVLTHFDGGEDTGLIFDPVRVRLTRVDGQMIDFERGAGISRVEDTNGNAITITPAGIVHSSGKSIAIARDSAGRIVRITDPKGAALIYGYDGGELSEFLDQAGNRTTFRYDARHNLLEIVDPLGNRAVRSEYDADGRLIAVTDANGARTEFDHDLNARSEVVVDALGHQARAVYDERGNVVLHEKSVTIDGAQVAARTLHEFDERGNETAIVDADDRRQQNTWDEFGNQLATVIDPAGLAIRREATYTPAGDTLSETDPNGDTVRFTVDGRRNTTEWIDVDGRSTALAYDSRGNVTSYREPGGHATRVTYDGAGRALTRTDSLGQVTAYSYDASGNLLTETATRTAGGEVRALTTAYEYDALNRLVRVIDPAGQSVRMGYDALGRLTSRTDQMGRVTRYEHDAFGSLTQTTYADGTTERREYDLRGDLIRLVDREGLVTRFEYDELRRSIATVLPGGAVARTIYSPGGLVVATIAPDGARTDYEYDAAGRRILMRQPAVRNGAAGATIRPEWRFEYDAGGRPTAVVDPRGHRREIAHDSSTRTTRMRFPDGTEAAEHFDQWGRTIRRVDQEGHATTFEYVADTGRLAAVTLPAPADGQPAPTWRFTYDERGNRLSQVDPLGRITRFAHDDLGRLNALTLPGGQVKAYAYDAVGHLTRLTEFDGRVTTYEYDDAGRLVRRALADGTEVTFAYTPGGRRTVARDASGETTYAYDAAGRLASVEQPNTGAVRYTYDVANRVSSIATPGGATAYEYDALGRVTDVTSDLGRASYGYDAAGNPTGLDFPNGVGGTFEYDSRNQLTALAYTRDGTTLGSFAYAYTPAGRRRSVTESGATTTFEYDRIGRLIREARAGTSPYTKTYEYDLAGNRTRVVQDGASIAYTYDANDRLLAAGSISYSYDANGNVLSRNQAGAVTTFAWTPDRRLASVTTPNGTTGYTYDAEGMRTSKSSAQGTVRYLVDRMNPTGLRQVLEERDGAGALVERHDYGLGLLASRIGGDAAYYQLDGQSSVRMLTDAGGGVTDRYTYDAFGTLADAAGTGGNDQLYAGQTLDAESGLYYMRERYYDPAVGRFLGTDPFSGDPAIPQSLHRYLYAGNDPVNFADPNGDFFTIVGFSLANIGSGAARAFEATQQLTQLCRIKSFAKVATVAMAMRNSKGLVRAADTIAGLIGTSANLGSASSALGAAVGFATNGGAGAATNASGGIGAAVRLFKYEHPWAVIGMSLAGLPRSATDGVVESVELNAKAAISASGGSVALPSGVDLELKGKEFGKPPLILTATVELNPFRVSAFSGGTEVEREICPIKVCGIRLGKVAAVFAGAVGANNGSLTGSLDIGIKVDAAFLPEVTFSIIKLPDDMK